jgi:hypothetical protein
MEKFFVPFSTTLTPGKGKLVSSFTTPVIVAPTCARDLVLNSKHNYSIIEKKLLMFFLNKLSKFIIWFLKISKKGNNLLYR